MQVDELEAMLTQEDAVDELEAMLEQEPPGAEHDGEAPDAPVPKTKARGGKAPDAPVPKTKATGGLSRKRHIEQGVFDELEDAEDKATVEVTAENSTDPSPCCL